MRLRRVVLLGGWVHIQLAEFPGEGDLLVGADELVAEENHLVFEQQVTQFIAQLGRQWLAQVDAADLGADGGFQAGDLECLPGA